MRNSYINKNKIDVYAYFIELSKNLLKKDGVLSFIIPQTWKATDSFSLLRKFLFTNYKLLTVVNLEMGVFEAVVRPMIIMARQVIKKNDYVISIKNEKFIEINKLDIKEILDSNSLELDTESTQQQRQLFKKIEKNKILLKNVLQFTRGIKTSNDSRFISRQKLNLSYYKVFRGKNIKKYKLNWAGEFILYRPDLMKEKVGCVPHSQDLFEVPEKIVTQRVNSSMQLLVAYDDEQNYFLDTTIVSRYETLSKNFNLKYILGLLNSKLINFWYCNKYRMPTIGIYELNTIPIKKIELIDQKLLVNKVNQILALKSENKDTTILEQQIDNLVYKLYELTYEEVKIIDPKFPLTEQDYQAITIESTP
jgi:hypothetical protein